MRLWPLPWNRSVRQYKTLIFHKNLERVEKNWHCLCHIVKLKVFGLNAEGKESSMLSLPWKQVFGTLKKNGDLIHPEGANLNEKMTC